MIDIRPIPAFDDNYIWLISRPGYHGCAVVDPGDDDPVIERLHAEGLSLDAILITHKHGDHVGGVDGLKADWPKAVVYGPAGEPIRSLERRLRGGDRVELDGLGMSFSVLDVPGHTEGHIAYYGHGALFCGDTLFAGGCGRVFSGTFEQLSDSLVRIAELPVPGGVALGLHQALALEETDLRDRDVGELLGQHREHLSYRQRLRRDLR